MLEPVAAASLVQLFFMATVLGAKGERLSPLMLVPMIVMAGAASAAAPPSRSDRRREKPEFFIVRRCALRLAFTNQQTVSLP